MARSLWRLMVGPLTTRWSGPEIQRLKQEIIEKEASGRAVVGAIPGRSARSRWAIRQAMATVGNYRFGGRRMMVRKSIELPDPARFGYDPTPYR